MQQIHFEDSRAMQEIQVLFKSSRLIPFFGSGFTKGAKAKRGRVPDANDLTDLIKSAICAKESINAEDRAQIEKIGSLKTAFGLLEMPEYIPKKEAQSLLSNIFSEVDLSNRMKIRLLQLDWPHIFTFNIDDAIERATREFRILPPNRRTSREFIASHKCLFKIHGDISDFSAHEDSSLIFTWRDYGHSIESNKAILNFLAEEAQNSAFLFIGCSLDAELDLIHLTKNTSFFKSIYLKKGPATITEKIGLRDYGIEKVIYFDDYDQITEWLVVTLEDVQREPPIRSIAFDDQPFLKEEAISVITNGGPVYRINGTQRIALASSTFATRTAINEACRMLRNNDCLLVTGRRVSGKPYFSSNSS